eukprot:scaffold4036_cov248-Ochromonas_danica.AAC.9
MVHIHSSSHLHGNETGKDSLSVLELAEGSVCQSEEQAISRFFVLVLKHLQPAQVILVHDHVTDWEELQILHNSAGPFDHTNQFATELQGVDLEIDLEQNVCHGKDREFLASRLAKRRPIFGHDCEAFGQTGQGVAQELVVQVVTDLIHLFQHKGFYESKGRR